MGVPNHTHLITQPVTALDSVVCVPLPVVLCHVAQRSIYATLGCHCMASCRKQFGNAPVVGGGYHTRVAVDGVHSIPNRTPSRYSVAKPPRTQH